jgi:hypothetical protein
MNRSVSISVLAAAMAAVALAAALPAPAAETAAPAKPGAGFVLDDKKGDCLDVRLDDRLIARYMYAFDKSTREMLSETYKPYLHIMAADGRATITKGVGGLYTHHRGIFIGWQKVKFSGKTYNLWEMAGGTLVHQKFLDQSAGPDRASFTSLVNWNDKEGNAIIEEERTQTFCRRPAPTMVLVDFISKLRAPNGNVVLDGDPEHGGIQYRPHDAIEKTMTKYFFPMADVDPKAARDLPWVGMSYTLSARRYTVIDFNHPDNPKDTVYSAYRDYGRFGAFFKKEIASGEALTVKYRFWILDGEMPALTDIDKEWADFTKPPAAGPKKP